MSYGELSTHELKLQSQKEANVFSIPPEDLAGRDLIRATTVEEVSTVSINSAVSVATTPDGQDVLRFSVADIASFFGKGSATAARALRLGYSLLNDGGGVTSPMIPRLLSEEVFSLLPGEVRPALTIHMPLSRFGEVEVDDLNFTRDLVRTEVFTPSKADETWDQEQGEGPLSRLEEIASNLFRARRDHIDDDVNLADGFYLESEDGIAEPHQYPVGLFIIQEARFAANAAMGVFFNRHSIPAVYSNHIVPMDDEARVAENPDLAYELAQLRYSAIPQGHIALGRSARQPYAHVTDPLAAYDDLFNMINLVSHRWGSPGFTIEAAKHAAKRLNTLYGKLEQQQVPIKTQSQKPKKPAVTELLQRLESGKAHAGDVCLALFGEAVGAEHEIADARQQAANFLAANSNLARQVWQMAAARGWIKVSSTPMDGGGIETIATNTAGEAFPFRFAGSAAERNARTATTIGKLIGHKITPVRLSPEERRESDPFGYLRTLSRTHKLYFAREILERNEDTGEVTLQARLRLHGKWHILTVEAPSINAGEKEVAQSLIAELNLAEGVPPASTREEAAESPITRFNNHCARRGVGFPIFSFPEKGKTEKTVPCQVDYIDAEGNPQTIVVFAEDEKTAKTQAAEQALAQLPPPLPRKNKKKKKKRNPTLPAAPSTE